MRPPAQKTQTGISLIEVLIVMMIVSLLAFLLFPTLKHTIEKSRDTQCVNRLKTLYSGFMLYSAEHDGVLPPYRVFTDLPDGTTHRGDFWSTQIKPYVSPDAPYGKLILCPAEKTLPATHYAMNSSISSEKGNPERLTSIPLPSQRFLLGDANATTRITAGKFAEEGMFRHSGSSMNLLFLDGHVKNLTYPEIPIPANGFSSSSPEYKAFWRGTP